MLVAHPTRARTFRATKLFYLILVSLTKAAMRHFLLDATPGLMREICQVEIDRVLEWTKSFC
jgi:hypothetical protein